MLSTLFKKNKNTTVSLVVNTINKCVGVDLVKSVQNATFHVPSAYEFPPGEKP